jgi:hypothetical protein
VTLCLRWKERRARYRPAGEVFDTSRAAVVAIDEATAKAFVTRHHYSASYPAARFRAGLLVKRPFGTEQLAGVIVFSVPMQQRVVPCYFPGLEPAAGVELGRLVLLDEIPSNAESWFTARAFRLMRDELAGVKGIVSYSDPMERRTAEGQVVKPGHIGVVYQALNACYRGRTRGETLTVARDGRVISRRALSKLKHDETGAAYAYAQLRAMGAPERRPLEDSPAYIERAVREGGFVRVRHPGNHAYTWWLGDRRQAPHAAALPYPKREAA